MVYRNARCSRLRCSLREVLQGTCRAACTFRAFAHTDTAMVYVLASAAWRGSRARNRSAASTAPLRWALRKKCLWRSLRASQRR